MKKESLINALRWIAVLPAAVLAEILVYAISVLILFLLETSVFATIWQSIKNGEFTLMFDSYCYETLSLELIILFVVCRAIAAGAFVSFGSTVAPKGKKVVSIVLATMNSFLKIITIVFLIIGGANFIEYIVLIGGVIGAIVSAYSICKEV